MYEEGMTKFDNHVGYGGDRWLTREQGAKFFSVFKEEVLEETDTVSSACTFSDAAVVDKTLSASVIRSCEL